MQVEQEMTLKRLEGALRSPYLVEEVLHQLGDADVVVVAVDQQHLLQVFELGDGVVAVPRCLAALLTHDALGAE